MASILSRLAQALGKSEDEIAEIVAKKAAGASDEVSEAATIKNLQKEAADASVPMGSGKNLEALQKAAGDIPAANASKLDALQREAANAPSVDTERLINAENMGLSFDDVPSSQYKMPDVSGIKASQAAPDSLASTASKLQGSVDLDQKKLSMLQRMDPRLAGLAAMGIGGGALMMGGDEAPVQAPMAPIAKSAPMPAPELAPEAPKAPAAPAPQGGLDFKALEQTFDKGMAGLPKEAPQAPVEQDIDFTSLLRQAQEQAGDNQFQNALLRAGTQAGAAIAGLGAGQNVKADMGMVDALAQSAGKPVSDVKGLMESTASDQKLNAARKDLADENKLRDPNSEISKLMSDLAAKAGLIKPGQMLSGMALKNSGVNLGTLLSTIEAGKARASAAALAKETRSADAQAKIDARKEEEQAKRTDKRKLITEEVEDRYRNLNDSLDQLQGLVKKFGTVEVFGSENEDMNRLLDTVATDMAKYTDPNSVARPAEVQLWRKNLIDTGLSGMGMANSTASKILDNFKKEVDKRRGHAYKVRGISPDNEPTPKPGSTPAPEAKKDNNSKQVVKKQYSPSRDQTKLIFSDGSEEIVDGKQ